MPIPNYHGDEVAEGKWHIQAEAVRVCLCTVSIQLEVMRKRKRELETGPQKYDGEGAHLSVAYESSMGVLGEFIDFAAAFGEAAKV